MSDNGTMRLRKQQLTDSIERLDRMIDGLSAAIPAAVAESVREALGPALAAAIKDAVKAAVAEAMKEIAPVLTAQPVPAAASPAAASPVAPSAPPARPTTDVWTKVKAALGRLQRWGARAAAPVLTHAALGWAVAKVIGAATVRARVAAFVTTLTGVAAGFVGFVSGPIGESILLGLTAGSVTAVALWAVPTIRLFVALRDN